MSGLGAWTLCPEGGGNRERGLLGPGEPRAGELGARLPQGRLTVLPLPSPAAEGPDQDMGSVQRDQG